MAGRRLKKSTATRGGRTKGSFDLENPEIGTTDNAMFINNHNADTAHKCGCEHTTSKYINELRKNKLKLEIETIAMAKTNIQNQRQNLILHTENLEMKFDLLKKEIDAMKTNIRPKPDDVVRTEDVKKTVELHTQEVSTTTNVSNVPTEQNSAPSINLDESAVDYFSTDLVKIENLSDIPEEESHKMEINKVDATSKSNDEVLTPYVILKVSTSNYTDKSKRRMIFVKLIEDKEINEYFEIINDDPFMIQPLNKDVPMKYVDLQTIGAICAKKKREISKGILELAIVGGTDVAHVANEIRESNKISLKNITCSENIKNDIRSQNDSKTVKKIVVDLTAGEADDEIVFFSNSPGSSVAHKKRKADEPDVTPKKVCKIAEPDLNNDSTNDMEIIVPKVEIIEIN